MQRDKLRCILRESWWEFKQTCLKGLRELRRSDKRAWIECRTVRKCTFKVSTWESFWAKSSATFGTLKPAERSKGLIYFQYKWFIVCCTHSESTVTSMIIEKSPANRAILLSSKFPQLSSIILLNLDTIPGLSGPEAVTTSCRGAWVDEGVGKEHEEYARNELRWDQQKKWANSAPNKIELPENAFPFWCEIKAANIVYSWVPENWILSRDSGGSKSWSLHSFLCSLFAAE